MLVAQVSQNDAPRRSSSRAARRNSENMEAMHLTVDGDDVATIRALLLKARATELAELRRLQTQLSVYGDRRANMESEPAAIEARIGVLTRLLDQMPVGGAR
jgi:hypothetical protein